jgi:cleavage and polyadenylation specificity factor subunit 2
MSSILRFTPLYGVKTEDLAVCYLLEVDDFRILLDCGWNDRFEEALLEPLRRIAPRVDAVLISQPDLFHLGALPYAVSKLGLRAPTYATLPVWRMGQLFMYDAHQSRVMQEDFRVFDLDDVDAAFDKFIQLKYQQIVSFSERGKGISITPHPAGHMIGGTIWKIQSETDEILYASDFNHRRERHLNPTTLQYLTRPSHLIIGASQALVRPSSSSSASGQQNPKGSQIYSRSNPLMEVCEEALSTLRQGGDVLIPIDTAGRVLELALGFEQFWSSEKLGSSYAVALIEHVSFNTIDFAKSMMEWMSDAIINKFDTTRENPFHLKHIHLCHSRSELSGLTSPKVILASLASLECGFSRELIVEMASNKKNKLILVDRLEPNTLAHTLYDILEGESEGSTSQSPRIPLQLNRRVPLQGTELEEYYAKLKNSESSNHIQNQNEVENDNIVPMSAEDEQEEDLSEDEKDTMQSLDHLSGENKVDKAHSEMPLFSNVRKQIDEIWDDYGLVIDTKCFMIGEDPGEMEGDSEELSETSMDDRINNPIDFRSAFQEDEQVPTKCIQVNINLEVACQLRYIGCAGLSDGRSLRQLLTAVSPRRVIVVHGSRKETAAIRVSRNMEFFLT